ncbi:phosphoribosyl pyrophosphokinase [Pseudovirgaria hyperparasitica]|uniref:Ribose-phosphate pyrophosphokinase 1 n=1 Tax=Pseudovirgaria hyperparasitica TaxID=470096 RepID=A0A6A6WCM4_9PEZI|nr:phosphoribosyl pyrophosphokinase [Pseudovirgaria hyperparasitica]KAF2760578.1 phosphoribosyl pyrophosphokinase [Pseudovirgaria hyperparasitica]
MRQVQIFSGTSHPRLVEGICDRLGQKPGSAQLGKFSNGETSVQIQTSIRDQDVFIVQSGCSNINDAVIELLIMISACKGGSARSITAVMPYFPYARQSKKKSHRGAITAKLVADLLGVAGVNHVITIDLHASQMQGFFKCPVDNLIAEPLLARWIKVNIPDWRKAVVVSKNPGGTKRVTSLADALKLSFGIITAEQAKPHRQGTFGIGDSMVLDGLRVDKMSEPPGLNLSDQRSQASPHTTPPLEPIPESVVETSALANKRALRPHTITHAQRRVNGSSLEKSLTNTTIKQESTDHAPPSPHRQDGQENDSPASTSVDGDDEAEDADKEPEYTDERARHVVHGRLVHGHVVDDIIPSPSMSAVSGSVISSRYRAGTGTTTGGPPSDDESAAGGEHMAQSFISTASSAHANRGDPLGGSYDAQDSSEDEDDNLNNPELETHVTLVGNVKDRPVFIVDDIIDKAASWIAAAETVVKRGGATKVYCMATHGVFGAECLEQFQQCACIERVIITNSFPINEMMTQSNKLIILPVDNLLAEAIRRNHHGESISQLFMHYD